MIDYQGTVIPVSHYLMTGRKEGLYTAGLVAFKEKVPELHPVHGMADFEQAIKNALMTVFDGIDVHGCRFHFGQAVIKKLKAVGLQSEYLNTPAVKKWGKKYVALCTLPAHFIPEEFQKLKRETSLYPNRFVKKKMMKFEAYFTKYWMVQKTPSGFTTFGLRHRTNNSVESLHSQMQRSMSTHPSLWRFLEELVNNVIVPTEVVVKQINEGHTPREPMRRARQLRAERQTLYEEKLSTNQWTPTR